MIPIPPGKALSSFLTRPAGSPDGCSPIPFLGIYDLFSARLVARRFDTLFVSGFGFSAGAYLSPDMGYVAWNDLLTLVQRLRHTFPHHHLLAAHVSHAMERVGASGLVLEDQRRSQRCGHLQGKEILPLEEYLPKLRAVLAVEGCDAVLADGLEDLDRFAAISRSVQCPIVAKVIGGGLIPPCDRETLWRLRVDLLLYSTPCLFAAQRAVEQQLQSLTEEQLPFSQSLIHGMPLRACQEVLKDSQWP